MSFRETIRDGLNKATDPKFLGNVAKVSGAVAASAAILSELSLHFKERRESTDPVSGFATVGAVAVAVGGFGEVLSGLRDSDNVVPDPEEAARAAMERANAIAEDARGQMAALEEVSSPEQG